MAKTKTKTSTKNPKTPVDLPGTFCPNCGQTRGSPKDGDPLYPSMYPSMVEDPHTDPFDCIRYLNEKVGHLERSQGW